MLRMLGAAKHLESFVLAGCGSRRALVGNKRRAKYVSFELARCTDTIFSFIVSPLAIKLCVAGGDTALKTGWVMCRHGAGGRGGAGVGGVGVGGYQGYKDPPSPRNCLSCLESNFV